MHPIPFLTMPAVPTPHAFFTREGGVSKGAFESLNCALGSNDTIENVEENLRRVAWAMKVEPTRLLFCKQIHSATVMTLSQPWAREERPQADALVTREKNIALGILTADCAPVLFCDDKAGVIGAAHAGWRGALSGVCEKTIKAMQALGAAPEHIHAVIGPCIQQNSYEVGPDFPAEFLKQDETNAAFFKASPKPLHFLFDLPAYILQRLRLAGLAQPLSLGLDTRSDETRFFSYRRRCLKGDAHNGTLISVIKN